LTFAVSIAVLISRHFDREQTTKTAALACSLSVVISTPLTLPAGPCLIFKPIIGSYERHHGGDLVGGSAAPMSVMA